MSVRPGEKAIEKALFMSAFLSVFVTAGIIAVLLWEAIGFFREVSIVDFLTDTEWTPLFDDKRYGILPLLSGTFLTSLIAMAVALPVGVISALFLSEYAPSRVRAIVKPCLEVLAAIPSIVYGYFALLLVTPVLQRFIPDLSGFNALSPGLVMGIMIIPLVSSLSEDAMYAVPVGLREGSLALGATKFQTSLRVVIPSAFSGIAASLILGVSRAIGETMVVAIAAGLQPKLTLNPLDSVETITAYIVQVSLGDVPAGTLEYKTIYAVGMSLFVITFVLNIISHIMKKRFRERYE